MVENEISLELKFLRSDNGRKYCRKKFEKFYALNEIRKENTISHTLQKNCVVEPMNRMIVE